MIEELKEKYEFILFLDELKLWPRVKDIAPVGSTYILGEGADIDFLVCVDDFKEAAQILWNSDTGYESDLSQPHVYDNMGTLNFMSFRRDDVNLIMCDNVEWFNRFKAAAEVCKFLKVDDKELRIKFHRLIRDGRKIEEL